MIRYDAIKQYDFVKNMFKSDYHQQHPFPLSFSGDNDSFQEIALMAAIINESTQDNKFLFELLLAITKVKTKIDTIVSNNKPSDESQRGTEHEQSEETTNKLNKEIKKGFADEKDKQDMKQNIQTLLKQTVEEIHRFLFTSIDETEEQRTFEEFDKH